MVVTDVTIFSCAIKKFIQTASVVSKGGIINFLHALPFENVYLFHSKLPLAVKQTKYICVVFSKALLCFYYIYIVLHIL